MDFLGLAALLLTVGPLLLQLLKLVIFLRELLVALGQFLVVVVQLRIVGVERLCVHLVSRFEGSRQLSLLIAVLGSLVIKSLLQLGDLCLQLGLARQMLLLMQLAHLVTSRLKVVLTGLAIGLLVDLLVLEVFELLLTLLTLVLGFVLEL